MYNAFIWYSELVFYEISTLLGTMHRIFQCVLLYLYLIACYYNIIDKSAFYKLISSAFLKYICTSLKKHVTHTAILKMCIHMLVRQVMKVIFKKKKLLPWSVQDSHAVTCLKRFYHVYSGNRIIWDFLQIRLLTTEQWTYKPFTMIAIVFANITWVSKLITMVIHKQIYIWQKKYYFPNASSILNYSAAIDHELID